MNIKNIGLLKASLKLTKTIFIHKYYVYILGRKLELNRWRLLIHDLSKFSKQEFFPYAKYFYTNNKNEKEFSNAVDHHYENNSHHWEYCVKYPHKIHSDDISEMVADWVSAKIVYDKSNPIDEKNWTYLKENIIPKINYKFTNSFKTVMCQSFDKLGYKITSNYINENMKIIGDN